MFIRRRLLVLGAMLLVSLIFVTPAIGEQQVTLRVAGIAKPSPESTMPGDIWTREQLEKWEKTYPNVKLEFVDVPWAEAEIKYMTMVVGRDVPDVAKGLSRWWFPLARLGALKDLDEALSPGYLENFFPRSVELNRFEGIQVGVPSTFNIQAVAYNKTVLDKAGIKAPKEKIEDAWTWKEFAENMAKAQAAQEVNYAFIFWMHTSNCRLFPVYAAGGSIFSEDFKTNNIDNPETLEALEFMVDCAERGLVPLDNMSSAIDWTTKFAAGDFIGWVGNGNWSISTFGEIIKDFEWDFTFLPTWRRHSIPNQGDSWCMFKLSKNKEWGAKFIEFMTSKESLLRMSELTSWLTPRNDVAEEVKFPYRPDLGIFFLEASKGILPHMQAESAWPAYPEADVRLRPIIDDMIRGKITAKEAHQKMIAEVNEVVELYK
jgi:ABC-type glycerol-3-phosphate transport system substrate-binding protein